VTSHGQGDKAMTINATDLGCGGATGSGDDPG
jgi:hypothetical protein